MKLTIDTDEAILRVENEPGSPIAYPLYGPEAFDVLSLEWLRVGWSLKQYHSFTWMGGPVLQLPEDLIRLQEVLVQVKPDVIIETGVYLGGSVLFHASICELLGKGRVIGIDLTIATETRQFLHAHSLHHRIKLFEGDSKSDSIFGQVKAEISDGESVLVLLDSDHSKAHVAAELEVYSGLVTPGSWLVVTDGIMKDLSDVPNAESSWRLDNPFSAANDFEKTHPEFERRQPAWLGKGSQLTTNVTYWPNGWFFRKS